MPGEIIRMGDRTSHGGTVLEGSPSDICMGKPIAFIGHQTHCPKCRGTYPIVEGVLTTTFYGKGIAVAGMKTACGAVLIASQFTDMVEWSSGASAGGVSVAKHEMSAATQAVATVPAGPEEPRDGIDASDKDDIEIERFYSLRDADGNPSDGYRYDLHVDGQLHTKGGAYANGTTVIIAGEAQTRLVTWLARDSGLPT